ncbi:unnamed protein product [Lampetra planeri]
MFTTPTSVRVARATEQRLQRAASSERSFERRLPSLLGGWHAGDRPRGRKSSCGGRAPTEEGAERGPGARPISCPWGQADLLPLGPGRSPAPAAPGEASPGDGKWGIMP